VSEDMPFEDVAGAFIVQLISGKARSHKRDAYKPSTARSYISVLEDYLVPAFGPYNLSELQRRHIQHFVLDLEDRGLSGSRIRNILMPLRIIYRHAMRDNLVDRNPCEYLDLPPVRGKRPEVVNAEQAAALIERLPVAERAIWGTAFYAGLRCGELQALRWEDIDLDHDEIHVTRSMDAKEGVIDVKSDAGERIVPIPWRLRTLLLAHKVACKWADGLAFGRSPMTPFSPSTIHMHARKAWGADRIGLHAARHTAVSLWISAGFDNQALMEYAGHSSAYFTISRYGHLLPGKRVEDRKRLDASLGDTGRRAVRRRS
jgi:integrase